MDQRGIVAYKVVMKRHRYGSNCIGCEMESIDEDKFSLETFKRILSIYPGLRKYFPKYKKGVIVKEVKGTMGIFCFKEKRDAERFINENFNSGIAKVIKVEGSHTKKTVKFIAGCFQISNLVEINPLKIPPSYPGVICFKHVKVLE